MKKTAFIPLILGLIGAGFIVAAVSGFTQRPPVTPNQSESVMQSSAAAAYPLTTCVVSGEKLGEMGKPVVMNYQGTEVRFCCAMCVDQFKKDPTKYLAKLPATPKS